MRGKMFSGEKILAARVTCRGSEGHFRGHRGVGDFVLHGAGGAVRRLPGAHPARRIFDVAAKSPFAGFGFSGERIEVIGKKLLRNRYVYLSFILFEQLRPAFVTSVGADGRIL